MLYVRQGATMTIFTLPLRREISEWIEQRVARGEYASPEDYVSMLIERDRQERSEEDKLAELRLIIAEAEASGISTTPMDEIFQEAVEQTRRAGTFRE
jgi:Arc/MetJ-type ribon-helix-helix transcriptional regulator